MMSANGQRDVWVTGVGLSSSIGDGAEEHWTRLGNPTTQELRTKSRAGHLIFPAAAVDLARHIPNRLDVKRWGAVQSLGVHAAGDALVNAGLKESTELLARTLVVVAGVGGERDVALDHSIFRDPTRFENSSELNRKIVVGMRPSLFLAQLPNLLAGNISITFGVAGGSRTVMGEELAGVNAMLIARQLVADGVYDVALVGGSFAADREDLLLLYGFGGFLWRGDPIPVWSRAEAGGGLMLGTMSAFLVLEGADHAQTRNANPLCRLVRIGASHSRRNPGDVTRVLSAQWDDSSPSGLIGIISGASGVAPITDEERAALRQFASLPVRTPGSLTGHGMEASFPFNIALATLALQHGTFYPPFPGDALDPSPLPPLGRVVVTSVGHWRGESLAILESIGSEEKR
jgi:3-oxoacyl-[acyl-carrier-protein] synthase II